MAPLCETRASPSLCFLASGSFAGAFSARAFQLRDDDFDLADVVGIVPGEHAGQVRNGFLAALQVHAVAIPTLARESFEHRQVVLAQYAEDLQRAFHIVLVVVEYGRPDILIEGLGGGSAVPDDQAHAPTGRDLHVR